LNIDPRRQITAPLQHVKSADFSACALQLAQFFAGLVDVFFLIRVEQNGQKDLSLRFRFIRRGG
jgi:hypothetical protein